MNLEGIVGDFLWIGGAAEDKLLFFAGGLYLDVAVIKDRLSQTFTPAGDILDPGKVNLGDAVGEEAVLLCLDKMFIGEYQDIALKDKYSNKQKYYAECQH